MSCLVEETRNVSALALSRWAQGLDPFDVMILENATNKRKKEVWKDPN
jgi:hypothetical protein